MPPGIVHRLVSLRAQVLQGEGRDEELVQVRDQDVQEVPPVLLLRSREAAVLVGRMTNVDVELNVKVALLA